MNFFGVLGTFLRFFMTSQPGISWENGSDPYFELEWWISDKKYFREIEKGINIYFFEILFFLPFLSVWWRHNQVYPEKMGVILILSYGMKLGLKVFQTDKKRNQNLFFPNFSFLPSDDVTTRYIPRKWGWPLFWARGMKLGQKVLRRNR